MCPGSATVNIVQCSRDCSVWCIETSPLFKIARLLVRVEARCPLHRKRDLQHHLLHGGKTKVLSWTAFLAMSESVG